VTPTRDAYLGWTRPAHAAGCTGQWEVAVRTAPDRRRRAGGPPHACPQSADAVPALALADMDDAQLRNLGVVVPDAPGQGLRSAVTDLVGEPAAQWLDDVPGGAP
jgi:hypothetical protein